MHRVVASARAFYGANPLHLLVLLAAFAVAGYAAFRVGADPSWPWVLIWFAGAVIGHDLVLFPLYALADRAARPLTAPARPRRVPVVNYVRVPALGAGLTFLLFFPGIIRQGEATFTAASGLTQQPYLARWLLLVAAMFAISAALYAVRLGRAAHAGRVSAAPSPHGEEQMVHGQRE
ncbi:hypothetical protein [Pseudonocardia acidicola]|uniref:hypothetical protein n=1 Tax=Pseudonocardia acidicola TaxID=2724939 RepID=UPI001B7CDA8C|nr:hypothetical protein [Pseudonocardia acidicola]